MMGEDGLDHQVMLKQEKFERKGEGKKIKGMRLCE